MRPWVKLYTEIIDDPKIGKLSLADRGVWMMLLALAGQLDDYDDNGKQTGRLSTLEDVAWHIRCPIEDLASSIEHFKAARMIHEDGGVLVLTHFAERQDALSGAERARYHRRNRGKREYYETETLAKQVSNEPVTNRYVDKNRVDTESRASAKNADAHQPLDLPKAADQMAVLFPQSGNGVGDVMRDVCNSGWTIKQQDALRAVALFLVASKLPIPNDASTRKDWLKAVHQQLTDFGVGILERAYPLAVQQMLADGLTVSRPGSLTKTLPAIVKTMRTKPPPRPFTTESIYDDDAAQGDTS